MPRATVTAYWAGLPSEDAAGGWFVAGLAAGEGDFAGVDRLGLSLHGAGLLKNAVSCFFFSSTTSECLWGLPSR